ncbi:MAG: glycosyltransferase, partial [Acutalibacteraceae bacterium]|nr:glycosyltransferase [Acutalibacteraceae bacterium]
MSDFKDVTIMTGAVTETDSLRKTVLTLLNVCDSKDLREIIISYSPKATPECKAVVDELASMKSDVPIITFQQNRKGLAAIVDMIEIAKGSHCILLDS